MKQQCRNIFLLIGIICCTAPTGFGQFLWGSELKAGEKLLEKQEFDKLFKTLNKSIEKEPENIITHYLFSRFYFNELNPYFQIDSAYRYNLSALRYHLKLSENETEKLKEKEGLERSGLIDLKQGIEEAAFQTAVADYSIAAFQRYIKRFSSSVWVPEATAKRDSIAFAAAQQANTYQAYRKFLADYPDALQASTAEERYHKLLYATKTKAGNVESYSNFIRQHPESPFRLEAERLLFYRFVYDNQLKTYEGFVRQFPDNSMAPKAWEWIWYFHENKADFLQHYPEYPKPEEVKERAEREKALYFPFMENKKIGFIGENGLVGVEPKYVSVWSDYRCDGVTDDFLIVKKGEKLGAADKFGKQLLDYQFDHIEHFGPGVILFEKEGKVGLHHKGNFPLILPKYDEIKFIDTSLIAVKRADRWGIVNYYDSLVFPFELENISVSKGGLLILRRHNRFAFLHTEDLMNASKVYALPEHGGALTFQIEEFQFAHENFIKYKKDSKWGIMTYFGREIIPPNQDIIEESRHGWVIAFDQQKHLYTKQGNPVTDIGYQDVLIGKRAYGVKQEGKWGVIDTQGEFFIQPLYDTLFFVEDKGILLHRDQKKLGYFYGKEFTDFSKYRKLNVQSVSLPVIDSVSQEVSTELATYIITEDVRSRKGLLSDKGELIVPNRYNFLSITDEGMIMVGLNGKRGLLNLEGKPVLPVKYDGIAKYDQGYFSILGKTKKFGAYHAKSESLIAPVYDALLKLYGPSDSLLVAKKGKFGLINQQEEVLADFIFDEIRYWNDSVCLVAQDSKWRLFNFREDYFLPESFDTFEYLYQDEEEILIVSFRSSGHGLLSNKKGRLMPEEYSEIINLSDWENPIYLAEKYLGQAELYILLLIDKNGEVLKEQVVKEVDYERIACE